MKKIMNKIKEKINIKKTFRMSLSIVLILSMFALSFLFPNEQAKAVTLISGKQSTYGSPAAKYTFSATYSSRTSTSIVITATCSGYLTTSGSWLGTGYGLVCGIYLGGSWRTWTLKSQSASWSGTTSHSASASFTVSGLSNTTTSLTGIYVRVLRSNRDGSSGTAAQLNQVSVGSMAIPANASYVVSYNANGGTNAPANETKWYGVSLTLTTAVPVREGYEFVGWATTSDATTATYQPGASYTGNAALSLYAVWAKIIELNFVGDADEGMPSNQSQTIYNGTTSVTFIVPETQPFMAGFKFLGWGTTEDAKTPTYTGGETVELTDSLTLYAIWQADPCFPFLSLDKAVYSWSTTYISPGATLESISGYTTDYTTLNKTFFLKHNIGSDNTVESQEVCYILNSNVYCLKGGDNGASYETNKTTLLESFGEDNCAVDSIGVGCSASGLRAHAYDDGRVGANGDVGGCSFNANGDARCSGY